MQHINPKGISISSKSNNIDSNLSKFHTCNEMHKKKNKPSSQLNCLLASNYKTCTPLLRILRIYLVIIRFA